jgi:hypothetical protein
LHTAILKIAFSVICILFASHFAYYSFINNNNNNNSEDKGKVVPVILTEHHAMKGFWGSGGIAQHIPDLGTRWK